MMELRKTIEDTWNKRELLKSKKSIRYMIKLIDWLKSKLILL